MRIPARITRIHLPLLAIALATGACRDAAPRATLTVSAAASLRDVLAEAEQRFERDNPGVDVRTNFGASGALAAQIQQGAPVDVFISAAEGPMRRLEEAGLIDARSRRVLAGNELVLIAPAADSGRVSRWEDLATPAVRQLSVGAPASVPAGEYAEDVFRTLGIRDTVMRKAVLAQDVRQVLAHVSAGEVDAGVVYRTDVPAAKGRVRVVAGAPAGSHRPSLYPVAVTAVTRQVEQARAYVAFLLGPQGRELLRARGFRVD
ncbi:MAG TPA: molybdate ABC transporter substrate-binding protein [Longimicrobium sp.]|nr:molybdate ABC transporter substrate-binding protein [Longimicrobium sp.]